MAEKILILTAGFGDGHNSAAKNIAEALAAEGAVSVEVLDPFAAAAPGLTAFMKWGYQFLSNQMPWAWRWLYDASSQGEFGNHVWDRFVGLMRWLEETLAAKKPDVLVMTYPLYAHFIPGLNPAVPRPRKVFVAVTDSISIHPIWTQAPADEWFVTDPFSRDILLRQGVPGEKCFVTGFAVPTLFRECIPTRDPAARSLLYLATTGSRHVAETVKGLMQDLPPDVNLTIVTGRHEKRLRPVISKALRRHPGPLPSIIGWCSEVPALLLKSNLVLTKAGGATVHECFCAGIPAVINYAIPGQEEGNAELLVRTGCGCRTEDPAQTGALIREIFTGGDLEKMTAAMQNHRRTDGAWQMARRIMS